MTTGKMWLMGLALSVASLPIGAETCIVSGDTARSSSSVSFGPDLNLEARAGTCAMGEADVLSPFESRIGSWDWGLPMNLNSAPPNFIIIIR